MTLADKICVLSPLQDSAETNLEQFGSPLELYHNPQNKFVAGFIGSPKMNFLKGSLIDIQEKVCKVKLNTGDIITANVDARRAKVGDVVELGIRPEHLVPTDHPDAVGRINGLVNVAEHLGAESFVYMDVDGEDFTVKAASEIYMPISGTIAEVNEAIIETPELLNEDPHGKAWLVKIESSADDVEFNDLLDYSDSREEVG
jgi:multiple sugar transport system ATP-binding protein